VFEESLRDRGVPLVHLGKKGPWDFFRTFWRLLRLIQNYQPDVVYSFMLGPNIFAALAKSFVQHAKIVWGIRTSAADWRLMTGRRIAAQSKKFARI
jgi:hypothetical protein